MPNPTKKELKEQRKKEKAALKAALQAEKAEQKKAKQAKAAAKKQKPEEPAESAQAEQKLVKLSSTQNWSPIKDIRDGIVITKDGRYVRVMEFAPINFFLRPIDEQYNICNIFGAAIRVFPTKFHIKVLSRKASVESHIQQMRQYQAMEQNENCRQMQEESIRQIIASGKYGVSRRFFLSFEYEQPAGLRRPSWYDIRNTLSMQANQIKGNLEAEPCNNTVIGDLDDTDHVMGILYDCMCRAESEIKPLEDRIVDVVNTYAADGRLTDRNMTIPINDVLVPQSIRPDISPAFIVVDGRYITHCIIPKHVYATEVTPAFLSALINMGEGVDVDIWVEKVDSEKVKSKLSHSMSFTTVNLQNKDENAADLDQIADKLESSKYIRAGLSNDMDFMYFSVMLTISATDEDILKQKIEWVKSALLPSGFNIRPLRYRQEKAFKSSLPLCAPDRGIFKQGARNILSSDFGACYPFTSYEINDRGGVLIGKNASNGSPIFVDPFNQTLYNNGNMLIFGSPGSGKTYLLQCLALRLRQQHVQTIIIAPHKGWEFRQACEAVGGQFISFCPGSKHRINIMEIRRYDLTTRKLLHGEESVENSLLKNKIQQLLTFFSLIEANITKVEQSALDEAIKATYRKFGITANNKSLEDPARPGQYKKMPILRDLYNELAAYKDAVRIRQALKFYVDGTGDFLNAQTNVNLNNPYIVIDVSDLTDLLLPLGMYVATDYINDVVQVDPTKRKAIFWDEFHRLVGPSGSKRTSEFAMRCWKLFRGCRAICVAATQSSTDLLSEKNGDYGKNIMDATRLKMVMKVDALDAQAIGNEMNLSPSEVKNVQYYKRGQGLFVANRNHAEIAVTASPVEHTLITSDPTELNERIERIKAERKL